MQLLERTDPAKAAAGLRFLLVEDHPFQRLAMAGMLESMGAEGVQVASDGGEALSLIQSGGCRADVVISDLEMPGVDGIAFLRQLREARADVSLILASALDTTLLASVTAVAEAYQLRLLGVLQKPLLPQNLAPLLLRHRQAPRPQAAATPFAFSYEDVRAGLHNDEFEPWFQPKIDVATGRPDGAEALARWLHPVHGPVAPAGFLQICEDSDLLETLTWVMLEKVAAFWSVARAAGAAGTVSVNLSARSLNDVALADRVTALVQRWNLAPSSLVFEVTETAAMSDLGRTLENLSRLRMRGFGLSIDDFGTGYSSLLQLTRVAFTELKIDRSFVSDAVHHEPARIVLGCCLDMARQLQILSVAEGVETTEQLALVRRLGVDQVQGFLFAAPMPRQALLQWTAAAPVFPCG